MAICGTLYLSDFHRRVIFLPDFHGRNTAGGARFFAWF